MTDDGEARQPVRRRVRLGRRPRPLRRALIAIGVLLVLAVCWIGVRGVLGVRHLQHSRTELTAARADLSRGDAGAARAALQNAASEARSAERLTGDPVWHLAGHTPFLGVDLRTAHAVAAAAAVATAGSGPLLSQLVADLDSRSLRRADGSVDLAVVQSLQQPLNLAQQSLAAAEADLETSGSGGLGPVRNTRDQLLDQLSELSRTVQAATRVVGLAPGMLGQGGPRHYFVVFQNPAQARGTGGYLGAYAVVTADAGRLHLDTVGTDNQLVDATGPVTEVSPDFTARYRALGGDRYWGEANLTPDFADASKVWLALYRQKAGIQLDGVLALDPEATGAIVSAAGPVTLPDGTLLAGTDVARYVESEEYARYPNDLDARRTQLKALVSKAFGDVTAGAGSADALITAMSHASAAGELLFYSSHPAEQSELVTGGVAGILPEASGPFAALVLDNDGANKMDYYLDRTLSYVATGCASPTRATTITVTLRNTAPAAGLPLYVAGFDDQNPAGMFALGTDRSLVSVYASVGATLDSATLNGAPVTLVPQSEHRHPVFTTRIDVPPGRTEKLVLDLTEQAQGSLVPYTQQALPRPMGLSLQTEDCPADAPLATATG